MNQSRPEEPVESDSQVQDDEGSEAGAKPTAEPEAYAGPDMLAEPEWDSEMDSATGSDAESAPDLEAGADSVPEHDSVPELQLDSVAGLDSTPAAAARPPLGQPEPYVSLPPTGVRAWISKALPWVSLVISIAGAVMMDRSESRGGLIAAAAAVSWLVLFAVELAHREPAEGQRAGRWRKLARFSTTAATQSLIQLPLFFSAPFYLAACGWTPSQLLFLLVFALAVVVSLWDPLCERFLTHPLGAPVLNGFASFVGYNAALPMLGVPNRYSVWLAALIVSGILAMRKRRSTGSRVGAWAAALALPVALAAGAVTALPPAPLRLVDAGIGTGVKGRVLQGRANRMAPPRRMTCWTAIRAPLGLHEKLAHVWSFEGREISRVDLDVRGGRKAGFRTWSRQRVTGGRRNGQWRCQVQTSLGQVLGTASVRLDSSMASP